MHQFTSEYHQQNGKSSLWLQILPCYYYSRHQIGKQTEMYSPESHKIFHRSA